MHVAWSSCNILWINKDSNPNAKGSLIFYCIRFTLHFYHKDNMQQFSFSWRLIISLASHYCFIPCSPSYKLAVIIASATWRWRVCCKTSRVCEFRFHAVPEEHLFCISNDCCCHLTISGCLTENRVTRQFNLLQYMWTSSRKLDYFC